ncbi:hypothetical protein [Cryobacterium tagatosivorans]|uniref:hypothetical protein n=1 Tax=Cryobacterium tagatosivorans TaxID=1259199 RepID=UPI001F5447C7|nr:hypothetical protein [Cryobacterium tagatosivorans]
MAAAESAPTWARGPEALRSYLREPVPGIRGAAAGWHSDDLEKGVIKVVYSGTASDKPIVIHHVRRDSANAVIKGRHRMSTTNCSW